MNTRLCVTLLLTLTFIASFGPASQPVSAQATVQPLQNLLSLIPDMAAARPSSGISLGYADYRAAEKAANINNPSNSTAFDAMSQDQRAQIVRAYSRIMVGPAMDHLLDNI